MVQSKVDQVTIVIFELRNVLYFCLWIVKSAILVKLVSLMLHKYMITVLDLRLHVMLSLSEER